MDDGMSQGGFAACIIVIMVATMIALAWGVDCANNKHALEAEEADRICAEFCAPDRYVTLKDGCQCREP